MEHSPIWTENATTFNFPSLREDTRTEVVVIGAGITGVTAAYLLAKKGVNVILLDKDMIARSTTGHTTAKLTVQHGLVYDELINHFGIENTHLYVKSQYDAMEEVKKIIKKESIDCSYEVQDAILYTNEEDNVKKLEKELEAYHKIGIDVTSIHELPFNKIPILSGISLPEQAQFHPLLYVHALITALQKMNVPIYEHTLAVDIKNEPQLTVKTKKYDIKCDHVVVATHFPIYDPMKMFSTKMYPSRSYVTAFTSDEDYPSGMYLSIDKSKHSLRSFSETDKKVWIFGGESHDTGKYKDTLNPFEKLTAFAEETLPVKEWQYKWSAQDYTTLDKIPYIGKVKEKEEIYVATGYRKWGMTNSTVAAKLITDLIIDNHSPYKDLFKPTRFNGDPGVKEFMKNTGKVTKDFVTGKIRTGDETLSELKPGEATKIRDDINIVCVYKDENEKLHAVDTTCTHLGCEVNWNNAEKSWDCPCHGSRFNKDGDVLEGPAIEPLKKMDI
ncbi:glycine/D-amino acid oxidase-like deaminating enzyme/nitrite reductase/ring-hydroxylating ferredoxin subunit [Gracilibacillus halotolerans]|uniref:Glycine/D-amino acid oxidase-like deaminating enzyme/nitrite reductase/ring-hydroxylating ferredoxin subunit n=1 Tax=Gracilibacillus halotolerans TaxID=74386 RepID=A0A841RJC5_9BACI|nr:FAD-dependent oxidoreductase [Gracilibacillus halotolerans]MBB6511586.1 glycine/D-amino acid oxidase-like deaminating enzyme/nitrite reductase/ring-hydroxylating ferredoxin subunit [Gracilibacillus halotolerans]